LRAVSFSPEAYVPFTFRGARIGWLRPELAARLGAWPGVFRSSADQVILLEEENLAPVVEQLAKEGFVPGWRNERYRIANLFDIERAAARPFGLTTHAVHANGVVGARMWLARRSATKPIDPGMWDNLVGGGISAGFTLEQTLVKESWEEAGIPAALARTARRGARLSVLREVPEGVQSELIESYDLELPESFQPKNQDGEVSEFVLLPFEDAVRQELTYEAGLVARDCLSRRSARPASAPAGADRAT
jgi:8-oxo-dGTP pyrophosphatase MutT (NUDIX family)